MPHPSNMTGKAALITGAASGLGRATALALAKAQANLLLVDVNASGLEGTASEARSNGVQARCHVADLSLREASALAVAAAISEFGRLDALCNVAGILHFAHTPEMAAEQYERTIAVNLNAPFFLAQAAIPHLLKQSGAIVNVTSSAAFVGEAYLAAYCASKAGLNHMTKALAMEYSKTSLRVNAVAPGGMVTGIAANLKMPNGIDYELIKRFTGLRGVVDVDDVASMIAFLASDAARGYHGAIISIDNGITAG